MTLKYLFSVAVLGLLFVSPATGELYSEFYQYTDEYGVVRYTDDLSMIPDDQRPDMKTYEAVRSQNFTEEVPANAGPDAEAAPDNTSVETGKGVGSAAADERRKKGMALEAERKELLQEYNDLTAEKNALGKPPSKYARTAERDAYTEKANELNRKIDDYQTRFQAFEEKAKALNQDRVK